MPAFPLSLVVILIVLALCGCDRDDSYNNNTKTSFQTSFQKPLDGKLSEQQVADYILIRQKIIADVKAQKLAKKMTMDEFQSGPPVSVEFPHFDEIEMAAAESFNMSYEEFQWIKDTVITAQTKLLVKRYYDLNRRIMTLLDQTLARYKEINTEKMAQQEQQTMDGYVADMKQEMSKLRDKITTSNEGSEALEHNMVIVTKFQKELELLQQQASQSLFPK